MSWCSHPESNWGPLPYQGSALPPELCEPIGAGSGNRTRVSSLEGWGSTAELYPPNSSPPFYTNLSTTNTMVEGGGFEPPKLTRQIYSLIPLATREPLPQDPPTAVFPGSLTQRAAFYGNWVACAIVSQRFSTRVKPCRSSDKSSYSAV